VGTWGFFLNFSNGGPKVVKFDYFYLKLRKQPFFSENFKIQGALDPPFPTPMYISCMK